jgi:two-component system phosphate regulon sensor histidine kinase PhoR
VLAEAPVMPVVSAALRDYAGPAAKKNIEIDLSGDASARAAVDAALLEQAVGNIIDNAVKYSEPGGRIQIRVARESGEVRISVTDRGIGIPAEHIDRIFERFYRVDKARSRKAGGTGLGLSIVKHIAALHHGRVTVESAPGEGSTFTIVLPEQKTTGGTNGE